MIQTPAHKQTDPNKKPGQWVQNLTPKKQRITFSEWKEMMIKTYGFCNWQCEDAWKAAQENK